MAANFFDVLKSSMDMRDDLNVIIAFHDEVDKDDNLQTSTRIIKVGSKSIKEKLIPEGLFTYVFFTEVRFDDEGKKSYGFITNNDGTTTAKSPLGCFNKTYIPNDLNYVIKHIDAYNNDEDIDLDDTEEESEING